MTNLHVVQVTSDSVEIGWDLPVDPKRVSFDVFVNDSYKSWIASPTVTSFVFHGLDPDTNYTFGITAVGDPSQPFEDQHYSPRARVNGTTINSVVSPSPANGRTLVWGDDFNSFDSSVWSKEYSTYGDGNNELQCYRPENVSVTNGKLVLSAVEETYTCASGFTRHVTSGMVRSQGVRFEPGQTIEFRIKLNPVNRDEQSGLFPAVWASSWNGGGWPTGGEFDFFEYFGRTEQANAAIHYSNESTRTHEHMSTQINYTEQTKFSDDWHVVEFTWGEYLTWKMDGVVTSSLLASGVPAYDNPFLDTSHDVTQLKINFALGGDWTGPLDNGAIDPYGNTTFEMDYIRIYEG